MRIALIHDGAERGIPRADAATIDDAARVGVPWLQVEGRLEFYHVYTHVGSS